MNSLLIVATLILGASAIDEEFLESARKRVKATVEECVAEEKASQADFQDIMNLKVPASHEGKCVYFCAHKKFNIQNDDGSLNKAGALETFEIVKDLDEAFHGKLMEAYDKCVPIPVDPDKCVYALNFFKCVMEEATKGGVMEIIIK